MSYIRDYYPLKRLLGRKLAKMTESNDSISGAMSALNLDMVEIDILQLSQMTYQELAQAKGLIESNLSTLFDLLTNKYEFDMNLPLVIDGYPRNDIDVVSVRLIRTKIIRLRNDHSVIMQHLATHLSLKLSGNEATSDQPLAIDSEITHTIPFALVKLVVNESPSAKAGLKSGDRIIVFDKDIHVTNHDRLTAIAKRVNDRKNVAVEVVILRDNERMAISLIPSDDWEGKGLLGCQIVQI